jgi:elongation factor G
VLLEPIMKIEVECPEQFQGAIVGDITSRRGIIQVTETRERNAQIVAEVPLSETFGYATDLRSMTQGQGTFTMELALHRRVPTALQQAIVAERKESELVGA